ncbi:hypothetical protein PT282_01875 [Bifidobacterium sp. ESL0763]|uniref:hypothetical protein n=1 Tax=Bifidobacterium sp. ESL0763 TaxID=2983227 RepID=UPI0023F78D07|nr:hypothetical protein [Bifidobacterium sp. ESL0763]MDF7663428.1 hypothetical protein [Bifidobacterium sp. ESL0763]
MRVNPRISAQLDNAESQRRCLHTHDHRDQQILRLLAKSGEVTRTRHGLYARSDSWSQLGRNERYFRIINGLHHWHPEWVFAGISAISAYGIEHPSWLHDGNQVFLATGRAMGTNRNENVRYIQSMGDHASKLAKSSTVPVTEALCHCAKHYRFHEVLPMFDSALRNQLASKESMTPMPGIPRPLRQKLRRLLHYADPLSENGGESLCRAIMLEEGFGVPRLQQEFRIRNDAGINRTYRVDMTYQLPSHKLIAVEFDGMGKYVNPEMTNYHSVRQVVHEEKERERDLLAKTSITKIVRLDFTETMRRTTLVSKLIDAGLPRIHPFPSLR